MAKKAKTREDRLAERKNREISLKERIRSKNPIKDTIDSVMNSLPVTSEIPDEIVAQIMEIEDAIGKKMTRQHVMVHALVNRAMQGSVDAFRELVDRTEGKVANKNENKNMNLTYEDWLKAQAGQSDPEDSE